MMKPIRTTLIFGIISCLAIIPLSFVSNLHWQGAVTFKLFFLLNLILYSVFLCRWSNTRLISVFFPLLLVTGVALWPNSSTGFILAALAVLSWIRSGICFKHVPLRAFIAEVLTITGGAGYYILWRPDSPVTLALALWLFFLVQTLYFFIVPIVPLPRIRETANAAGGGSVDAFEQASQDMKRVLMDGVRS